MHINHKEHLSINVASYTAMCKPLKYNCNTELWQDSVVHLVTLAKKKQKYFYTGIKQGRLQEFPPLDLTWLLSFRVY